MNDIKLINKTDKDYPPKLLKINNPPQKLYVLGNESLLNNVSLAVVGSRSCTEYGINHAREFTKEIAKRGITIISGLALGIDSIAHETAKNLKGKTIAVVGCGLNYIYPEENKELFKSILSNDGCIISEYEPNEQVNTKNFPKRNRIISGLSNGVFVVEASDKSGSGITGRLGLEQGKPVFCLPRRLEEIKGKGTNKLIQKGAKLVVEPKDILKKLENDTGIKFIKENLRNIKNHESDNFNKASLEENIHVPKEYMQIYKFTSYTPQNIQYFTNKTGLKIAEVTQKLIIMELQGYIKSMPGNYYIRC